MNRIFSVRFFYVIMVSVMNMSGKQRKYTFEEKLRAVKRHIEDGIGCTTVAKELGCDKKRILVWSKKFREGGEDALKFEARGKASKGRIKTKNFNSLEEELKYVKAERDILKKTLEILKKQQKV